MDYSSKNIEHKPTIEEILEKLCSRCIANAEEGKNCKTGANSFLAISCLFEILKTDGRID